MNRKTHRIVPLSVLFAAVAWDCGGGDSDSGDGTLQESTQARLNWKRAATLERDLAAALELSPQELCTGPEGAPCISQLYLVALGGNDPFEASIYNPVDSPLVTTPVAVDRVMFSACARRAALDAESGAPVVFGALELGGMAPEPDSEAVLQTATTLFRRFIGRDPLPVEVEIVGRLTQSEAGERVDASSFATTACYAVGSTTEFFFF